MPEILDALSVSASVVILSIGAAVVLFSTAVGVVIAVSDTFE